MDAVKWAALNWPWVLLALGVLGVIAYWGKTSVTRQLELRHERKLEEIKARAATLPYGHNLSTAELVIGLNDSLDIIEHMIFEAKNDTIVSIALQDSIRNAETHLASLKQAMPEMEAPAQTYPTTYPASAHPARPRKPRKRTS